MKILIVGLGLIGGSYAKGLKKKGHYVYGVDKLMDSIVYAKDNNIIDEGSSEVLDFIDKAELIILGLYPNMIVDFIKKYDSYLKSGQIVTDVCGTKTSYLDEAQNAITNAEYISHHPMAGREVSGVIYSDESIFKGANFLITPQNNTKYAIDVIKSIGKDLEFKRIIEMTPTHHDDMIAFTSQLTHAIAVSLVNSDYNPDTINYIGDSYRDLTRIAKINEVLWSELFFENKEYLIKKINDFEKELNILRDTLINNDKDKLKELFINSTNKRKTMDK